LSRAEYSTLDRILHRLALGQAIIAEASFDIDQSLFRSGRSASGTGEHVFIAGLARGGTTVLMRRIHASGQFRSLTYRDMPFVLMPRLWEKMTRRSMRQMEKTERAHADGVMVDYDSPEAFEEVFWRILDGDGYIRTDRLTIHQPGEAVLRRYVGYVQAILDSGKHGATRYLAKNNNNILRLPAIASTFPQSTIIVPFREPVQHANSLRRQHLHFLAGHDRDAFMRDYMTWLAHHEFGSDHRPFMFADEVNPYTPELLDYWLYSWVHVYHWLSRNAPGNTVFISYESLCDPASHAWPALARKIGIDPEGPAPERLDLRQSIVPDSPDASLAKQAQAVYADLRQRESE